MSTDHKALYKAVMAVQKCQEAAAEMDSALSILAVDVLERINARGFDENKDHLIMFEAIHTYRGMSKSIKMALSLMFNGFQYPNAVKSMIKGDKPVDDPDYVKACVI